MQWHILENGDAVSDYMNNKSRILDLAKNRDQCLQSLRYAFRSKRPHLIQLMQSKLNDYRKELAPYEPFLAIEEFVATRVKISDAHLAQVAAWKCLRRSFVFE